MISVEDSDAQFLLHDFMANINTLIECPTCDLDLSHLTVDERNTHCNNHFAEPPAGPSAPSTSNGQTIGNKKRTFKSRSFGNYSSAAKESQDVFWYSSYNTVPPHNFTPGLIPLLKKSLLKSHSKGTTQKAYLCSPTAVHVGSEFWDRGWGCGYRNYLMAAAALMAQEQQPRYSSLLDTPSPPGIRRLQKLIEEAWREGYDEEGAGQLKHKLSGTTKWIGTAELYVAFTYRGISACLVDFELRKRGPELLVNWIVDYFSRSEATNRPANINQALLGASSIVVTDRPPIVLQHSGHSRTVVGFERRKDGSINLLMFDPSRRIPPWLRQLAISEDPSQSSPRQPKPSLSPSKHRLLPSKLVDKVLHPTQHGRPKRKASNGSMEKAQVSTAKRVRAGDDVIVISDDEVSDADANVSKNNVVRGPPSHSEVDWNKLAELFRVKAKSLEKKDKYQVLYFPLTEPLTALERSKRKVVTSERIPPAVAS